MKRNGSEIFFASMRKKCMKIRVFTEVTFGIPRNTEFYTEGNFNSAEFRIIPRNSDLFNSAELREIPRNSVSFFVHEILYFKERDSLGRDMGGDTERKRKRKRDRGERDRRKERKRQKERDRGKETG